MITLQLVRAKFPAKISRDLNAFEKLLPRVSKSLSAQKIKWDLPKKSKLTILIHIITDHAIKKMNTAYRNKPTTTDVLSFSYIEGKLMPFAHEPIGEIFISYATALRQAKAGANPLSHELTVLAVHGALHIMGYDHEKSAVERTKMRRAEEKTLTAAGLGSIALTNR